MNRHRHRRRPRHVGEQHILRRAVDDLEDHINSAKIQLTKAEETQRKVEGGIQKLRELGRTLDRHLSDLKSDRQAIALEILEIELVATQRVIAQLPEYGNVMAAINTRLQQMNDNLFIHTRREPMEPSEAQKFSLEISSAIDRIGDHLFPVAAGAAQNAA